MSKKIENLEVKYRKKEETLEVQKRLEEIYEIDTRHAIIMAIATFGSSNIKKLGKLLGKNEATIYYHIKELLKKPAFLQIDEETTNKNRGIFYTLTPLSEKYFFEPEPKKMEGLFNDLLEVMEKKSDEEIAKFYYEMMAKHPDLGNTAKKDRKRIAYNNILEDFMLNNLEHCEKELAKGKRPKNKRYPIGSIFIGGMNLKISTPRQLFEILKVISDMFGQLSRLQEKFTKESDKMKIPEEEQILIRYHMTGGELSEFEFE
ncbi:MAG: hypothetical protein EU548_02975 [Promethearchaeota archaeon]|nr:MAG: hypothetical protein EU548_02975 [Candidatus Lokiarchaeota archaeon]